MDILEIAKWIVIAILGGLALYAKTNQKLAELAAKAVIFIKEAELAYKDSTKSGGAKFEFVVNKLYTFVPAVLKPIITKDILEDITQRTFDQVEAYAKEQLDKRIK